MSWPADVIRDRSRLLPPAAGTAVENTAHRLGVVFPQDYMEFLLWADGGILPSGNVLLYSVGPGLHPAETLLAANENRPPNFPLLLIGRTAFEEFGFLRNDLQVHKQTCPVYLYFHETDTYQKIAESFRDFVQKVVQGQRP